MNDELLKQQAAEIDAEHLDRFKILADVADDDNETEATMIEMDDSDLATDESETAMSMPEPADETEPMETEAVNAEIVENAPLATTLVAGEPPSPLIPMRLSAIQPQNWMPWPQYPITAQGVFDLALTVVPVDPARLTLKFFYEAQLKRECNLLIPHPIPSFYPQGIRDALIHRRNNPAVFVCQAIDVVLMYYLKNLSTENDNDIF